MKCIYNTWLDEGVSTDTDVSKTQNENNVKGEEK